MSCRFYITNITESGKKENLYGWTCFPSSRFLFVKIVISGFFSFPFRVRLSRSRLKICKRFVAGVWSNLLFPGIVQSSLWNVKCIHSFHPCTTLPFSSFLSTFARGNSAREFLDPVFFLFQLKNDFFYHKMKKNRRKAFPTVKGYRYGFGLFFIWWKIEQTCRETKSSTRCYVKILGWWLKEIKLGQCFPSHKSFSILNYKMAAMSCFSIHKIDCLWRTLYISISRSILETFQESSDP